MRVSVEWWATLCCGIEGKLHLEPILNGTTLQDTQQEAAGGALLCLAIVSRCVASATDGGAPLSAARHLSSLGGLSIAANRLN